MPKNVLKLSGNELTIRDLVEQHTGPNREEIRERTKEYGETGTLEGHIGYIIGVSREMFTKWYRAKDIKLSSLHKIVSGLNDGHGGTVKILVSFDNDLWHEITQFGPPPPRRGRPRKIAGGRPKKAAPKPLKAKPDADEPPRKKVPKAKSAEPPNEIKARVRAVLLKATYGSSTLEEVSEKLNISKNQARTALNTLRTEKLVMLVGRRGYHAIRELIDPPSPAKLKAEILKSLNNEAGAWSATGIVGAGYKRKPVEKALKELLAKKLVKRRVDGGEAWLGTKKPEKT